MKYLNLGTSEARRVLVRMLRELIEHSQNGRLEQCTVIYTMKNRRERESFVTHFAPNDWRSLVARLLIATAGQLLGGSVELMKVVPEVGDKDPSQISRERMH